jgi:hypothetical protein
MHLILRLQLRYRKSHGSGWDEWAARPSNLLSRDCEAEPGAVVRPLGYEDAGCLKNGRSGQLSVGDRSAREQECRISVGRSLEVPKNVRVPSMDRRLYRIFFAPPTSGSPSRRPGAPEPRETWFLHRLSGKVPRHRAVWSVTLEQGPQLLRIIERRHDANEFGNAAHGAFP